MTRDHVPSTDGTLSQWLWRWRPLRLSKRQSLSPTVLFRTTLTRTITLHELLILLGSNHLLCIYGETVAPSDLSLLVELELCQGQTEIGCFQTSCSEQVNKRLSPTNVKELHRNSRFTCSCKRQNWSQLELSSWLDWISSCCEHIWFYSNLLQPNNRSINLSRQIACPQSLNLL